MKPNELREMTKEELDKEHLALLKEQFNVRIQRATGQLKQKHLLKKVRRNIARVNTILNEKAGEK